jgi:hypothetical protein
MCCYLSIFFRSIYIFSLPVNGANTRHIIMSAYAFAEKPVSNFPGKHGGVILLVLCNRIYNMGRGYFGFAATDHTGFVIASLIEPAKKERYRASKQVHIVGKAKFFSSTIFLNRFPGGFLGLSGASWGLSDSVN